MTSDGAALVLTEEHPHGVVELALNRPEALNALSTEFVKAIRVAVGNARDRHPTVLLVTSRCDNAFSVGADLKERARMSAEDLVACRPDFLAAYRSLLELPFPVVCGIHGFALGGGFELALTCDLVVADETCVVGLPEVTIGLIPGGGGTQLLGRRTGWGPAADLVLTGRRVGADEALRLGMLDRVVPVGEVHDGSLELATTIAKASPTSLVLAKGALRNGWGQTLEDGLLAEDALWRQAAGSADRVEGIRAFVEKRKPSWSRPQPVPEVATAVPDVS
jgi:enoyl-CoA hydratase/carnithine racemase